MRWPRSAASSGRVAASSDQSTSQRFERGVPVIVADTRVDGVAEHLRDAGPTVNGGPAFAATASQSMLASSGEVKHRTPAAWIGRGARRRWSRLRRTRCHTRGRRTHGSTGTQLPPVATRSVARCARFALRRASAFGRRRAVWIASLIRCQAAYASQRQTVTSTVTRPSGTRTP